MEYRESETNQALLIGTFATDFEFSHKAYGEGFYVAKVESPRLSGAIDTVMVTVPERLLNPYEIWAGDMVEIRGEYRSFNKYEQDKSHLILTLFAKAISACNSGWENKIFLDGYLRRKPIYRETPSGMEIADLLLAVNRQYGRTDYIPCICWGRNARFSQELDVGNRLKINGRIQSREYRKRIGEDEFETKTAYEVSCSMLEVA